MPTIMIITMKFRVHTIESENMKTVNRLRVHQTIYKKLVILL